MKQPPITTSKADKNNADKRLFFVSLAIFIGTCVLVLFAANRPTTPSVSGDAGVGQTSGQIMTLQPEIVANLTQLPQAELLAGELADQVRTLQQRVAECPEYRTERRQQMNQHIDWLLDPSQLPRDVILALGANPTGRLIFGMATYTSSEWGLKDRPPESCLLNIGHMLNDMLSAADEERFPEFD